MWGDGYFVGGEREGRKDEWEAEGRDFVLL